MVYATGPVTVVVLSQETDENRLLVNTALYDGGPLGARHCPKCKDGHKLDTSTLVFGPTDATEMHVFDFASMDEAQAWVDLAPRNASHPLVGKVVYAIINPEETRGAPLP
jgi:hypothetical protein